jgi:F420-dependent methylenetetrahydromethanopterin dehydrogenase
MIIGVPGVLRAVSGTKLIQQTIEKLIEGMSAEQRQHFKIIVINAERDLWRGSIHGKDEIISQ